MANECWVLIDYILCSQRQRSSIQSAKRRPEVDCGSDHEFLTAKFRLQLKVRKTTRPFAAAAAKSPQSCPTLCNPIDGSLPGSSAWYEYWSGLPLPSPKWSIPKSNWLYSLQPKMEKFYTVSKNKTRSWLCLRSSVPITNFRLKLKKVGKTIRPFRYDLNQIPCHYTVEVRNT